MVARVGFISLAKPLKHVSLIPLFLFFSNCQKAVVEKEEPSLPNIILILADDLGYGDIQAYNPDAKMQTPNLDKLVSEGMHFTDAHSSSAVCTPSRYSLLTGRYSWRTPLKKGVLWSYGRLLMDTERLNIASLLQSKGYRTGVIGKWHLGLDWTIKPEFQDSIPQEKGSLVVDTPSDWLDFTKPIVQGPNACGFDESFIIPASLDIPPYCYIQNDTIIGGLTAFTEGNDLDKGYAEAFWRPGPMSEGFDFYQVLSNFTDKAIDFITENEQNQKPFFLYLPLNAPHTPWVASQHFADSSRVGKYGDFVQQVDFEIGRILQTVDNKSLSENTLIIFTSDNGPYWKPDFIEKYNHRSAAGFRGMKADIWEGGHRVPFILKWPTRITKNTESNLPLTHTSLLATIADIVGQELTGTQGEDSESLLPYLINPDTTLDKRTPIIYHSSQGVFAIRSGSWKLIEGLGSGGFSQPTELSPSPDGPKGQLYKLDEDISESNNLYLQHPEIVKELTNQLNALRHAK